MKVQVFAHHGKLIMNPSEIVEIEKVFWPTGGSKMGCVLADSKRDLQVSQEALDLMREIDHNQDCVGDIDWWVCDDGSYAFSWWGPIFRLIEVYSCEAARGFKIYTDQCTIIPNKPTDEMKKACEADWDACYWRTPIATDQDKPKGGADAE